VQEPAAGKNPAYPPPASSVVSAPPVPASVRYGGVLVMACSVLWVGLMLLGWGRAGFSENFPLSGIGFQVIIFCIGLGLRAGIRQAVVGLGVVTGLFLLLGVWIVVRLDPGIRGRLGAISFITAGLYALPLLASLRHWRSFRRAAAVPPPISKAIVEESSAERKPAS